MNKILTIIVPSYNISQYIESIVTPYLNEKVLSGVNILFIDDGAKDNTVEMLEPYAKKYPESIFIVKKQNGGHGSVINYGSSLVKTKYFKVIDGDDWIDTDELIKLCNHLHNCDDDIIVSNFIYEYSDRSSLSVGFDKNLAFPYKMHLHNVTIKTSLWIDNKIKVREKVFYEDAQYVFYPLEYAKTISYFDANIYHYRCDNPNQSVDPKQQLKHKDDYVLVANDLCNFCERILKDNSIQLNTKEYIFENVTRIVFGAYEICSTKGLSFSESKNLFKELDSVFKCHKIIFKSVKKKYKKMSFLRLFGYFGLRLYLRS